MKRLLALLAFIGCSLAHAAEAAPPKIAGASISDDRMRVDVVFDGGLPESDVATPTFWFVLLATKTDITRENVISVTVTGCSKDTAPRQSGPCPPGDTVSTVALVLTMPAPVDLTAIQVIYRGPLGAVTENFKIPGATGSIVAGAKKDDADISVSGSYAWTAGDDHKYNIDSFAGFMHQVSFSQFIGAYGQAKSKDAASIDPQAFLVYGAWRYLLGSGEFIGPFQGAIANGLGGLEFSRKVEQRNFVVSPSLIVPFRLTRGALGLIQPGLTTPHGTLHIGAEVIRPLASKLNDKSWRYRGLFGATFTSIPGARVPKNVQIGRKNGMTRSVGADWGPQILRKSLKS